MVEYRLLTGTPVEVLHEAFHIAFADYQVKMDIPLHKFKQMLLRRGYDETISIGAFVDGVLIGFVMNGSRIWNGKPTAYDLGTAVVPLYRRQGLTSEMLRRVSDELRTEGIGQYVLEVLVDNSSARELYAKQGFRTARTLNCYRLERDQWAWQGSRPLRELEKPDLHRLSVIGDFEPSWQNGADAIHAIPEHFRYVAAFEGDEIIGYGVVDPLSGDIPQLAVHHGYRRQGIGRSLLGWLIQHTDAMTVSVLNVDADCHSMNVFLNALGFEMYVAQYELVRTDQSQARQD